MRQQREVLRKEKETAEKIAARAFAQSYLADLVPTVFGTLSDNGYFYDPVERGKLNYWKQNKFTFNGKHLFSSPDIQYEALHNTECL